MIKQIIQTVILNYLDKTFKIFYALKKSQWKNNTLKSVKFYIILDLFVKRKNNYINRK